LAKAERHKKRKKITKKLRDSNPSYRDYRLKTRIRAFAHFSRFYLAFFFAIFVLFRLRQAYGATSFAAIPVP
jgi:hypothetical protein